MGWTNEQYEEVVKTAAGSVQGLGHVPAMKNKKKNLQWSPNNGPQMSKVDGIVCEQYRLTVTCRFSDL